MGEAFLLGHGNVRYLLSASFPPGNNSFIVGDTAYDSRLTVVATLGNTQVTIDPSECVITPATIAANTTQITVTKTIGGMTRSVSVPISVKNVSSVFNDNSWDTIAYVAKKGLPSRYWNIGDSKFFTMDGRNYEVKIISFTADPLSVTDEEYNDMDYNRNSRRAAMVLQFFTSPVSAPMHNYYQQADYDSCYMRNNVLENLYNSLPNELKSVIRLVTKYSSSGFSERDITTQDRLFIPSVVEYEITSPWGLRTFELAMCFPYDYYKIGIPFGYQWTRSMDGPGCTIINHYLTVNENKDINAPSYSNSIPVYPIFNI